jgi:GNAT superfamily N-acetyltransferase
MKTRQQSRPKLYCDENDGFANAMKLYSSEISGDEQLRRFIKFPWKIYRDYPNWVPPLFIEMRRKLNPRKNPFFEYGQVKLFGVWNESHEMVGRIAAIYNPVHRYIHQESTGFFGLFESINSVDVARRLFTTANEYLSKFGCTHLIGPVNFNTNDESGLLIEGYDERPMLMCNYSPPYYAQLLSACGFNKLMDLLSYGARWGHIFPQKYMDIFKKVSKRNEINVRPFNRNQFLKEITTIREIYNGSFIDVWGFVPLSTSEAEAMGKNFISFSDDELVWIAEYKNKPAGFILALPDVNEILKDMNGKLFPFGIFRFLSRRRSIRGVRVIVLCVHPMLRSKGIETLLIHKVHQRILSGGYKRAEFSIVNENNMRMRNILENFGFHLTKRYRIYRTPISKSIESNGETSNIATNT